MTYTVLSPLFSEIKGARQSAAADGKVAEVAGWLGRKGWQQRSLKLCCFSVTWRRPCHSSFFCLISHLSLRYTPGRRVCWHDSDTDRERKRRRTECALWTIQLDSFNLAEFIYSFSYVCVFLFGVAGNPIQFPFPHSVFLFVCQSRVI